MVVILIIFFFLVCHVVENIASKIHIRLLSPIVVTIFGGYISACYCFSAGFCFCFTKLLLYARHCLITLFIHHR